MIFKPKLIMIDVDGTLVDSVPDLAFCVDEMMCALGREKRGEQAVRNWVGNGVVKLVERALTGELEAEVNTREFEVAYRIFTQLYLKHNAQRAYLFDGVRTALDYLATQDCQLACVTNKDAQFTIPLLKALGVFDDFALVLSGDSLPKRKPDPLPLTHAAQYFKFDVSDCVLIGDSISDVRAARAAGFGIICVSYGYNHGMDIRQAEPDLVVDSLAQLSDYLK